MLRRYDLNSSKLEDRLKERLELDEKDVRESLEELQNEVNKAIKYPDLGEPEIFFDRLERKLMDKLPKPYPGFVTLDIEFMLSFLELGKKILFYLYDTDIKRPHNILITAKPGSGKSYFVGCLSKATSIPMVSGNLSGADPVDTLYYVLNQGRNYKAVDQVPILLLDEVESSPENLKMLLPLLWDGEFFHEGHLMKIGRCIIVCVISDPELIKLINDPELIEHLHAQQVTTNYRKVIDKYQKLSDFLSRLNGGSVSIPSLTDNRRIYDRVWIAIELTRRRFGRPISLPVPFLQFIANTKYCHEVRSLEALINIVPKDAVQTSRMILDAGVVNMILESLDKKSGGQLHHHLSCGVESKECLEECSNLNEPDKFAFGPLYNT